MEFLQKGGESKARVPFWGDEATLLFFVRRFNLFLVLLLGDYLKGLS